MRITINVIAIDAVKYQICLICRKRRKSDQLIFDTVKQNLVITLVLNHQLNTFNDGSLTSNTCSIKRITWW